MTPLPPCLEVKQRLDGSEQTFDCELVSLEPGRGILRYLIAGEREVAGIRLFRGCITYAVYWTDRPYNVYWWVDPAGLSLGFYFNMADSVELSPGTFRWRDLALDVFVRPDGSAEVLDESEVPRDLDPVLRRRVAEGCNAVLADPRRLIEEIRQLVGARLAARPRA